MAFFPHGLCLVEGEAGEVTGLGAQMRAFASRARHGKRARVH